MQRNLRQKLSYWTAKVFAKEKLSESKNADNEEKSKKAVAEVIIYEPKEDESLLREQEKFAYNAILIGQYEVAIELYKKILETFCCYYFGNRIIIRYCLFGNAKTTNVRIG